MSTVTGGTESSAFAYPQMAENVPPVVDVFASLAEAGPAGVLGDITTADHNTASARLRPLLPRKVGRVHVYLSSQTEPRV